MKRYKLLKDTYDGLKEGMIVNELPMDHLDCEGTYEVYRYIHYQSGKLLSKDTVENNPTWFQEIPEEEEWPKMGDIFYWVGAGGEECCERWSNSASCIRKREFNNIFHTKEEASLAILRRKAMAKRWLPKNGDTYYFYDIKQGIGDWCVWAGDNDDMAVYWSGNTHKNRVDAEKWGKEFGSAFVLPKE